MAIRDTNETQLASWLSTIGTAAPVGVFLCVFFLWGAVGGSVALGFCGAVLLLWFGIHLGLGDVGQQSRKMRLWIWGASAGFHLGLALLLWVIVGGFAILFAAVELFVALFSAGGFYVAHASPVEES